jgi:hypothetical protein
VANDTEVAKTFVNMLKGIVSRDPTVDFRGREVDGAITVTLTLRSPEVHHYPDGRTVRLEAGDSITFAVQGCEVGAPAAR